jgi:AcrR family transcriptional regulator
VLDTAAKVFAERGYHGTSMNDLVEATGLAAGGLYHYIGNKEKLLLSLFSQLMDPVLEEAERIVAGDDPPERQLRTLVLAWMSHVERYRYYMIVFQQEWRSVADDPSWAGIRDQRKRFETIISELLRDVHEEGGKPRDPRLASLALLAMVNYTPQWFDTEGRLSAEEIAEGYCDLIVGRVATRRTAPRPLAEVAA